MTPLWESICRPGRPARTWPMVKYKVLLKELLQRYPDFVFVLNYAPSEYYKAEELLKIYNDRVNAIPRGMNIRQVTGLLSQIDFSDYARHLADSSGQRS